MGVKEMLYDVPYGMTLLGFSFPCCNDKVNFQLCLPSSGKTTQQTMRHQNCSLCCVVQCTVATFVYSIWNETKKKKNQFYANALGHLECALTLNKLYWCGSVESGRWGVMMVKKI